jgi:D-serine deaminase-like pyridoxal phosphate-dependent protein
MDSRYIVSNVEEIPSPSLLIYRQRAQENIDRMVTVAGGPERLRPHVKTHKMPGITRMQQAAGITRQKCATLFEARMLAETGVADVFIAYQMVGPNIDRLVNLAQSYPQTVFRTMVDDPDMARALSDAAARRGITIDTLIDLDVGQHRTGITPGPAAEALYELLDRLPGLTPGGLHAYDGHNHQENIEERRSACYDCLEQVRDFQRRMQARGIAVPRKVMGGSISFPCYATAGDVETSPGTAIFWDWGYGRRFTDLPFEPAALVLSRVISIPTTTRATLDSGYKAIASDPVGPRGLVWNLDNVSLVFQNEEHWVMETPDTGGLRVGQPVYIFPTHICPTSALHRYVYIIDGTGRCVDRWEVAARDRE